MTRVTEQEIVITFTSVSEDGSASQPRNLGVHSKLKGKT